MRVFWPFLILGVLLLVPAAFAQESRPSEDPVWKASIEARAALIADAGIEDSDGELETVIAETSARLSGMAWPGGFLRFNAGYEYRHYVFSGDQPFIGGLENPWDDVHTATIGVDVIQGITREWGILVGATMRASAEDDADMVDGVSGIFLLGVGHDFGDGLRAGIGVVGIQALEDDFSVYPALQFEWRIDDEWTARLLGTRFDLTYTPFPDWTFGFATYFDGVRFRLGDDATNPAGVVDDRRLSMSLNATWRMTESIEWGLEVGADVWRRLRIEDRHGENGDSHDIDPAPFFGLSFLLRF